MALIICPECGREKVSDTAEMCPDCGYAIKNHFERINAEEEARRKAIEAVKTGRFLFGEAVPTDLKN